MGDGVSDNDPTRGLPRLSHHELARRTGDLAAIAGVREVVLANGPEAGVRALQLRNASGLEVEILIDRAFDIGDVRLAGVPISWRSGNQYRHPALHEVESEDGLSWLRTLDGFLVSGGLDHTLFGGEYDATHYNYPPKETVRHGLHGRLSSLPARLLSVEEDWNEDGGELRVTGEVVQATAFGEHLRLRRTVAIGIHGTSIGIDDTVENLGFERTPHMFLYHLNVGWPVVDEGTRFLGRVEGHRWSSDSTADQGVPYDVLPEPQRGFVEQVWEHDLTPGADGLHRVGLVRADGALGVEVAWDATTMPAFFEWQNLRDGQYAVGLEPSSHHVAGEQAARDDGSMTWLEHGETREYRTEITILRGSAEVAAAEARIQGGAR